MSSLFERIQARLLAINLEERVRNAISLDVNAREALLADAMFVHRHLYPKRPSEVRPEVRDQAREKIVREARAGNLGEGLVSPKAADDLYRVEILSAQNNSELMRRVEDMSAKLNERYGTNLPPPQVVITDNPMQTPVYSHQSDTILISAALVRNGTAEAIIAHELGERMSGEKFGDTTIHHEIHRRMALGLDIPPQLAERHRANECREDADAMFLVGSQALARGLGYLLNSDIEANRAVINQIMRAENKPDWSTTDTLTTYMNLVSYYPRFGDRLLAAQRMAQDPALLAALRSGQLQFDGACNLVGPPDAVRAAGEQGATADRPVAPSRP